MNKIISFEDLAKIKLFIEKTQEQMRELNKAIAEGSYHLSPSEKEFLDKAGRETEEAYNKAKEDYRKENRLTEKEIDELIVNSPLRTEYLFSNDPQ